MKTQLVRIFTLHALFLVCFSAVATETRKVIIDQDAYEGPGMQPMAMLIQAPGVEVVGITITSGDAWQKEQTQATLRMLELIDRTDIPVAAGATHPLVNSKARTELREAMYGPIPYKGAWMEEWPDYNSLERRSYHPPDVVPKSPLGAPSIKPVEETGAAFMLRKTREYPGEISILAMGPLTNIAMAQRLDDNFATRVKQMVLMGGGYIQALPLDVEHGEFEMQQAYTPRASFNLYWDPEAAHIVFSSPWEHFSMITIDATKPTRGSQAMLDEIAKSNTPVANYVTRIGTAGYPLWDETQAAVWLNPELVTRSATVAGDVNIEQGPNYGHFLTWPPGEGPGLGEQDIELILGVDVEAVEALFVELLSR